MKDNKTFVVHIQSTENSTWQGTIEWISMKKKVPFRSALELIRLIDSAVDDGGGADDDN